MHFLDEWATQPGSLDWQEEPDGIRNGIRTWSRTDKPLIFGTSAQAKRLVLQVAKKVVPPHYRLSYLEEARMSRSNDIAYLLQRANAEAGKVERATMRGDSQAATNLHRDLAIRYRLKANLISGQRRTPSDSCIGQE